MLQNSFLDLQNLFVSDYAQQIKPKGKVHTNLVSPSESQLDNSNNPKSN